MNIVLWIAQALLAVAFLGAGAMKLLRSKEALVSQMAWARSVPPAGIKSLGAVEILGALGVLLPWWTGIAPVLSPLAAVGLAVVMVGAIVTHVRLKETGKELGAPVVLLVLAVLVAVGRF